MRSMRQRSVSTCHGIANRWALVGRRQETRTGRASRDERTREGKMTYCDISQFPLWAQKGPVRSTRQGDARTLFPERHFTVLLLEYDIISVIRRSAFLITYHTKSEFVKLFGAADR